MSNATLQELLWPDSDGDRQSQNFRRAITDLRDALESDAGRKAVVFTERGRTGLNPNLVESDTDRFLDLLKTDAYAAWDLRAAEALAIYGGPLLATIDDDWVYAYRRQFEETFCEALESLSSRLIASGQAREALRIALQATSHAPLREEPYIVAIRAYASLGNRSMALQQFEALEKLLDDHFGQTPSDAAIAALDDAETRPTLVEPAQAIKTDNAVGGESASEQGLYVERSADSEVLGALKSGESVILVFGPRQVGKTSLLARTASKARAVGTNVVVTDFQSLGKSEVDRAATLYRALIHGFATQLGLQYEPSWNEWIGPNSNLDAQIDALLKQVDGRVCWALDEVDRLFGTEYADDFFGLVRSWHNRRALDPDSPWKRLSLVISYATEAHLFIKDLNQSPFNIGFRVNLRDFSLSETQDLGARFGEDVARFSNQIFELTSGHPFLTRRSFAFLASGMSVEDLKASIDRDEGPFADHLRHMATIVMRDESATLDIRRVLDGHEISGHGAAFRLWAAGLLRDPNPKNPVFRVQAYETKLRSVLASTS